ncbi:type II secretion system protein GspL [Brevundimonas denitrificans]|uniref:Type II secretion system protein GspL n=1 Tax=Brevundimonas denitrificans TaxID=1443434 RepID=A0ABQ6BMT8_9CAUL|nr:type II secretion system protein GspL [Brevundimonas denitrificans]GLS02787.1 type II secretion system protein GspL [Brevundimonas denitrificans]
MKPTRLILIPALGSEPAPCMVIEDGAVRDRGLLELHPVERPEPMRTVAIVPGPEVTIRWLDLPVGGLAQQRAAALWMLKEQLAAPPDRLATALGPTPPSGQARLVAVVGLPLLQAWIDYLEALGVRADAIVPDALIVPEPGEDDRLNAVVFGSATVLRGRGFAASVQPDLVELVAGSRRVEPIADAAEVERALIQAALAPPVNLLTSQDRGRGATRRGWALASAMAGLLVVSPLVLIAAAAARDDASARADANRARAEIVRIAPDLAGRPDPVEALRRRVRAAPPPGGVVGATAALFAAVEGVEGAELDLLIVDPAAGMKASITHADYQDTQTIARAMRAKGLEVTETAALNDRGRIVSDITIGSAR